MTSSLYSRSHLDARRMHYAASRNRFLGKLILNILDIVHLKMCGRQNTA